jgi:hypothetical protein
MSSMVPYLGHTHGSGVGRQGYHESLGVYTFRILLKECWAFRGSQVCIIDKFFLVLRSETTLCKCKFMQEDPHTVQELYTIAEGINHGLGPREAV